jgi:DNA-binding transcriptional ArsR family regulator
VPRTKRTLKKRSRTVHQDLRILNLVFEALAHPTRRQILLILKLREGHMTAGQIAGRFSTTWPTITRHLNALQRAGLVSVQQRGRVRTYNLEQKTMLIMLRGWLQWFERTEALPPEPRLLLKKVMGGVTEGVSSPRAAAVSARPRGVPRAPR